MTKRFLGVLLIICLAGAFAFADENLAESKTNAATAGRFGEEQDDYLDVVGFSGITKNLLFLSLGSPGENSIGDFQIGFANRFGGIYVGARAVIDQVGTVGNLGTNDTTRQTSDITLLTSPTGVTGRQVTDSEQIYYTDYLKNSVDVLVGVGKMGIGLSAELNNAATTRTSGIGMFSFQPSSATWSSLSAAIPGTTATSTTTTVTSADGTVTYEEAIAYDEGMFNTNTTGVDVKFGMPLAIAGYDAKIKATVEMDIVNNSKSVGYTYYISNPSVALFADYSGVSSAATYSSADATYTEEYIRISPNVFFGITIPVPLLGGSDMDLGLEYDMDMPIYTDSGTSYSVSYSSYDATVNGIFLETDIDSGSGEETVEISEMTNMVKPSVSLTKEFSERVKIGISYAPSFQIKNETKTTSGSKTYTETHSDGTDNATADSVVVSTVTRHESVEEISNFQIDHEITTGAQFFLTDKIRVNVGATTATNAAFSKINKKTIDGATEYTEYTYNNVTDITGVTGTLTGYDMDLDSTEPSQTLSKDDMDLSTDYHVGFTYFYDENMKIDLLVDNMAGSKNLFDFNTWTVEFTYSY